MCVRNIGGERCVSISVLYLFVVLRDRLMLVSLIYIYIQIGRRRRLWNDRKRDMGERFHT